MAADFIERFRDFCGRSKALTAIAGINIALGISLWIISLFTGEQGAGAATLHRTFALSGDFHTFLTHPWTLFTYMVTQFSLLHLLFNVIWLFWFGRLSLYALGERQLLSLYLGGGVTGGIVYLISGLAGAVAPGASLCGASASVLSLMAAVAITIPDHRMNLLLFGEVKMKWLCLVCIILSFVGLGGASGTYGGQLAHIGGVGFGAAFGILRKYRSQISETIEEWNGKRKMSQKRSSRERNAAEVIRQAKGSLCDHNRLDQLLDKIRVSGYSSLSAMEKRELDAISRRLRENDKTNE